MHAKPLLLRLLSLQVSIVRYRFRENCTEAKYGQVLAAFNAWQPWKLSKEHALAEVQCGYNHLQAQVSSSWPCSVEFTALQQLYI
jgi:hypothetical protein